MAAQVLHESEFTLHMPPPTPEELSSIMQLKAEHLQLLEAYNCYRGLFDVVYSELESAYMEDAQIRKENAHLRAELLALEAPEGLKPSQGQTSQKTLHEEGAYSMEDFLVYLADRAHKSSSEEFHYKDLPPDFPSLSRFSPHKGAEEFGLNAHIKGCGNPWSNCEMQPDAHATELRGALSHNNVRAACAPDLADIFNSYTSQFCGYHASAPPVAAVTHPEDLKVHAPQLPIDRHMPRPPSTIPVMPKMPPKLALSTCGGLLEGLRHSTLPTDTVVPQNGAAVTTSCKPMVQGDLLKSEEYIAEPLHKQAEACNFVAQSGLQQACFSDGISGQRGNVAVGSPLPSLSLCKLRASEAMRGSDLESGEHALMLQSVTPKGVTAEMNSTASSSALASNPIANGVTTLVVRNVPARYTKETLMQEWTLDGTYDFLFLPFNFRQKRTAGFAFVNFTSHKAAVDFYNQWHGRSLRNQGTAKRLSISAAEIQGLEENLRHVAACNVGRTKNSKYLPSVFNGVDEVPLAGLLEEMMISSDSGLASDM